MLKDSTYLLPDSILFKKRICFVRKTLIHWWRIFGYLSWIFVKIIQTLDSHFISKILLQITKIKVVNWSYKSNVDVREWWSKKKSSLIQQCIQNTNDVVSQGYWKLTKYLHSNTLEWSTLLRSASCLLGLGLAPYWRFKAPLVGLPPRAELLVEAWNFCRSSSGASSTSIVGFFFSLVTPTLFEIYGLKLV